LILAALTTGMRRGELFNTVWADIDFDAKTIEVCPKADTEGTWEWHIKDNDRRTLPLPGQLVNLLTERQDRQPEGYPYIFVPPCRYDSIQQLRRRRRWTLLSTRQNLVLNFTRQFRKVLKRAGVKEGTFHDLRRTALSNWLAERMSEYEVMNLAGHSDFGTTHKFYLAVADGLIDRAREASTRNLARIWRTLASFVGKKVEANAESS
jgi:integrase